MFDPHGNTSWSPIQVIINTKNRPCVMFASGQYIRVSFQVIINTGDGVGYVRKQAAYIMLSLPSSDSTGSQKRVLVMFAASLTTMLSCRFMINGARSRGNTKNEYWLSVGTVAAP